MSNLYQPNKSDVYAIVNSNKFKDILSDVRNAMPNETKFSTAVWSYILFFGYEGGFFGFGARPYEERFLIVQDLSLGKRNAVTLAASLADNLAEPIPVTTGQTFMDALPDALAGGVEEGVDTVVTALKQVVTVAALIYLVPVAIDILKSIKK